MINVLLLLYQKSSRIINARSSQIVLLFVTLMLYSTTGYMYFELPENPDLTWVDAFWWSIVTMTTVGYGDFFPVSIWGRILIGFPTMLLGVGILGYMLSLVATAMLESKMLEANGIIFCSPVYGHNVSGLMKIFIDRFSYNGHHPRFFKQKALFIANTCGMGLKGALKGMEFIGAWGFHVIGQIGIKWPHYEQSEKEQIKNDRIIEKYAKKFYKELKIETPKPQSNQVKQFYIMKKLNH